MRGLNIDTVIPTHYSLKKGCSGIPWSIVLGLGLELEKFQSGNMLFIQCDRFWLFWGREKRTKYRPASSLHHVLLTGVSCCMHRTFTVWSCHLLFQIMYLGCLIEINERQITYKPHTFFYISKIYREYKHLWVSYNLVYCHLHGNITFLLYYCH